MVVVVLIIVKECGFWWENADRQGVDRLWGHRFYLPAHGVSKFYLMSLMRGRVLLPE